MNFKRFNGSTWETVQHKIYGSGTDSLTAFPAQIQAAGEPLTDYLISGKTFQDGTPTPEAPVDVVGCGTWDETHQSYKLPITVNGTEHPIYLGQVETTRWIKKLVLTGKENWTIISRKLCIPKPPGSKSYGACMSTHFILQQNASNPGEFYLGGSYLNFNYDGVNDDVVDFKSYLATQHQNGTPVTVWYVPAEPETGIANEPLMKIGDYADTITMAQAGVTIQTFDGDNIISFGTTVQPSAMSAAFKGWHPVQAAKQYDGNDWS